MYSFHFFEFFIRFSLRKVFFCCTIVRMLIDKTLLVNPMRCSYFLNSLFHRIRRQHSNSTRLSSRFSFEVSHSLGISRAWLDLTWREFEFPLRLSICFFFRFRFVDVMLSPISFQLYREAQSAHTDLFHFAIKHDDRDFRVQCVGLDDFISTFSERMRFRQLCCLRVDFLVGYWIQIRAKIYELNEEPTKKQHERISFFHLKPNSESPIKTVCYMNPSSKTLRQMNIGKFEHFCRWNKRTDEKKRTSDKKKWIIITNNGLTWYY